MRYNISYNLCPILTIDIASTPRAMEAIREMVEFWMGWERKLKHTEGDYTKCWLIQLARYVLQHGETPEGSEGWYPLDGSYDIKLIWSGTVDIDDDLITIEEDKS